MAVGATKETKLGMKKKMDSLCAFPHAPTILHSSFFLRFICNTVPVLYAWICIYISICMHVCDLCGVTEDIILKCTSQSFSVPKSNGAKPKKLREK